MGYALAATDAEFHNRIILHDNTLNLPVVSQQRHPDPNYSPHAGAPCRRLKDFGRHVMILESRTASPTKPAGFLDYIKESLYLVLGFYL